MVIYRGFKKGIALIEIVIGLTIISTALVIILSNYKSHLTAAINNTSTVKATFLTEETFEAIRFLRDYSWSQNIVSLTENTEYYLYWNGSMWAGTNVPQNIDGFIRFFKLLPVYRDNFDRITDSGGTLDVNTKKVEVTLSWSVGSATTTKIFSTYITNLFNN
ncbi:MAG: hypothetical protein EXS50_02805 [Candidatus Taylorbacteria bacterium]|nr:hypothetical protein [Candidatus Taylorbacteria bacterium]